VRLTVLVLVAAVSSAVAPAEETIAPHGVNRTARLTIRTGDSVVLRPSTSAPAGFVMAVEVYDEQSMLVGRDDEEVEAAAFEWEAPRDGQYYFIVRNLSGVAGAYTLRIVTAGRRGATPGAAPPQPPTYAVVKVFYATNRVAAQLGPGMVSYASEPAPQLQFGVARVSVPRGHRMGELEGPSILRLEFRNDPERHITLLNAEPKPAARFFGDVASAASRTARREAFVFVHGFATTFEDAARRTAQIAYDLGFSGAPVLYSWPSRGKIGLLEYNSDARNAELSAERLKDFLSQLVAESRLEALHVIAHSMGNRVVADALDGLARSRDTRLPQLREVILMAPDIDAEAFRGLAARIKGVPARMTLYASSGDEALRASQKLSGYPRAGQGGADVVVLPGIDTVDASAVDTSLLGLRHSYYADNRTIVSDLFYLLRGHAPQDRAALRRKEHRNGTYWEFLPAAR
jgi:esterase/lipase superfamily enzyme